MRWTTGDGGAIQKVRLIEEVGVSTLVDDPLDAMHGHVLEPVGSLALIIFSLILSFVWFTTHASLRIVAIRLIHGW